MYRKLALQDDTTTEADLRMVEIAVPDPLEVDAPEPLEMVVPKKMTPRRKQLASKVKKSITEKEVQEPMKLC